MCSNIMRCYLGGRFKNRKVYALKNQYKAKIFTKKQVDHK